MTRILLITRCPPYPLYLGDRLILYHLAYEFSLRRDVCIDLLAFADRPDDQHQQRHYDAYFESVQLFPDPRRSPVSYLRRALIPAARWPGRAEKSWSPEMWWAIQRQVAENRYDLVHLFGGVQVYEFKRALGDLPAIITPYESYSLYLRRLVENLSGQPGTRWEWVMKRLQLALARRFESFMFEPYQRTVVVSARDRAELLAINPALRVEVIPNGVDIYQFRPRPTRRVPALLFVGNYEYAPNVDAALRLATEILPQVRKHVPGVKLWLVGNAPPPELLALQQRNHEERRTVRVTGRVPDVRPYLARAVAFVSPLRLGAGIKNKVLEALAMGCPVIGTPLSMDGISVRDGHDALISDGEAMIEAVVRLLNDANLQRKLSTNGRKLIEASYSWSRVADLYARLYEDVITQR